MKLQKDRRGVAGFFEDIPILIVVTIGIGIFMLSAINAYTSYVSGQRNIKLADDCWQFSETVRSYEGLLYEPKLQSGLFDCYRVQTLNITTLARDLHPDFKYQIQIVDVSDYPAKYNLTLESSKPPVSGKYTIKSAVNIVVSDSEIHPAQLIVTIWR